ncbi:MAG: class I SAM-dependent methyltransferase [Kangiellaceae bacterium]|nr:class I SAM-dependent methyltransferase [Kangiellaceae bacterium]
MKWLSKDMNEHDLYMADFLKVYETLDYWGPGSESDTQKALSMVTRPPANILDVGCGKGLATKVLAENSDARITAVDNEQSALNQLEERFKEQGISHRLETVNASMTKLPFSKESFDLIWAEGSAYIIGIENALIEWKAFLREQGYLMISDMVWRTDTPSQESIEFWDKEYPDIQLVEKRIEQMEKAGYQIIGHFPQSKESWKNYYDPLSERVVELESEMSCSTALKDIKHEVNVCTNFANEFGYHMFMLTNVKY